MSAGGHLGFHNDATASNTVSAATIGAGWHVLELHLGINGTASTVEVWLDGTRVDDLSLNGGVDLGAAPIGQFQIGDAQAGLAYDVVFDDAAFGSARLGLGADGAAPSVPAGVSAVATSPFSVDVGWSPSTDDVQVTGYDVFRDGAVIASVGGSTTSYTDGTALASTAYGYAVRAARRVEQSLGRNRAIFGDDAGGGERRCSRTGSSRGRWPHGRSRRLDAGDRRCADRWVRGRGQHDQRETLRAQDAGHHLHRTGTRGSRSRSRARRVR